MIIAIISGPADNSFADRSISLTTLISDVKKVGTNSVKKGLFTIDVDSDSMLESILSKGMFELNNKVFGLAKADYPIELRGISVKGVLSCVVIKMTGINNYSVYRSSRDVHFGSISYDVLGGVSTKIDLITLSVISILVTAASESIKNDKNGVIDRRVSVDVFLNEWSVFLHALLRYCTVNTDVNIIDVIGTIRGESRFNCFAVGTPTSKQEQALGLFQMLPSTINGISSAVKLAKNAGGFSRLSPATMFDIGINNIVSDAHRAPAFRRSKGRMKISCYNWYPSFRNKKELDQFWPSSASGKKKLRGTDFVSVFECYYGFIPVKLMTAFGSSYNSAMNLFSRNLDMNKERHNEAGRGQSIAMALDDVINYFKLNDHLRTSEDKVQGSRNAGVDMRYLSYSNGDDVVVMVDNKVFIDYTEGFSRALQLNETAERALSEDAINGIVYSADIKGDDETASVNLIPVWPFVRTNQAVSSLPYLNYVMGDLRRFDFDLSTSGPAERAIVDKVFGNSESRWLYGDRWRVDRATIRLMAFMDFGIDTKEVSTTVYKDGSLLANLKAKIVGSSVDMSSLADVLTSAPKETTQIITVQYRYPFKGL